ncbi:hypothetical protein EPN15_00145 [Patescibacteria group bacterium]|nr:MAG: hypothetical protein EPN15_00145 [Patescibacteria group bacterium]
MKKDAKKIGIKKKKSIELNDVLVAVNDGFNVMEERFRGVDKRFETIDMRFEMVDKRFDEVDKRFEHVDERFRQVFTILDGHTKKLEGLEQERLFSFHAVHRLEKEIERMKKHLHMN